MGPEQRVDNVSLKYWLDLRSKFTNLVIGALLAFLLAYSIVLVFSIFKHSEELSKFYNGNWIRSNWTNKKNLKIEVSCEIKVVQILCDVDNESENANMATTFERQINQTLVLIKSMLITLQDDESVKCVQVSIISDEIKHFEKLKELIFGTGDNIWHSIFTRRLKLGFIPLNYPKGTSWMRSLFRPCATMRLFLPDVLPYDLVLYLDTDIIFLQSIGQLWSEFRYFKGTTLAAMAPCLFHYGTSRNLVPYYGSSGLNAGIMLMNLSRMRQGDWTRKIKIISTKFRSQIKLADQDILNIYFQGNSTELHLLPCQWNFRHFQCQTGSSCQTLQNGISAIHGNALSFSPAGPEPLFFVIFRAFQEVQLGAAFDLQRFGHSLGSVLSKSNTISPCSNFAGFKSMVLSHILNQTVHNTDKLPRNL